MVEIEQEELTALREKASKYDELLPIHEELEKNHNSLKDDYITLCKGQQQSAPKADDFDTLCSSKFDKNK